MSRRRLFGRPQAAPAEGPDPWLDDPPPVAAEHAAASSPSRPGRVPPSSAPGAGSERTSFGGPPFSGPSITGTSGAGPAADVVPDPATRAARPALWTPHRPASGIDDGADPDPVTDPFGFPPVPPVVDPATTSPSDPPSSSWAAWGPATTTPETAPPSPDAGWGAALPGNGWTAWSERATAPDAPNAAADGPAPAAPVPDDPAPPVPSAARDDAAAPAGSVPAQHLPAPRAEPVDPCAPDPADAAALAAAFAADYLCWDEDDPERRGRVLAGYLPGPRTDRALLGWSGQGRQRTEMVLPGRVRPDGDGRVLVDVRVRVTPYRRVDQRGTARPEREPDDLFGEPATAPPATARGWRGLASRWVRLGIRVAVDEGRLVVDVGEQTLEAAPEARPGDGASAPTAAARPDLTLDGDDVPDPRSVAALHGSAR